MKKWCLMVAAMLCLMIPTVGSAQGLPDFLQAVQSGLSEGLSAGSAAMEKDLALSMTLSDSRVEEGRDVTLTIRAENPRPAETGVSLTLNLPERLAAQLDLDWNIKALQEDKGLAVFSIVGRDDEFGFANVEDKLPELEKVLGKENVSVRIVDGLGHGFGIGNETKVKNWLQEAVIFWEAHR